MFSEEFRGWSESAYRESDCVGLAGVIQPRQPTIGFGQSHACRPDQSTIGVFTTLWPRKLLSGYHRTPGARRERGSRVVTKPPSSYHVVVPRGMRSQELRYSLPTSLTMYARRRTTGVLDTAVRKINPISLTLAIIVFTFPFAMMAPLISSAIAPMCSIPIFSPLCPDTVFGGPSPLPYHDRPPIWAGFPDPLNVECKTLELLFDGAVVGLGFPLEIKKAETATSGLATLARVSNLNGREVLSDSLGEFLKGAYKVCHGLTSLRSRMGFAVDK